MTISATFLGGAQEVGRLGLVLEHEDARLLFDYGMSPDKPVPSYPQEAPPVDLILLSHAHLDHSGMLPWVAARYETTILATAPSALVASLLHHDSLKIAKMEGFPPMFDAGDIKHTQKIFDYVKHTDRRDAAGTEVFFHNAGHIPGSTMFEVRGERRIVFTGDLMTRNSRLLWGAHPVKCDLLFMEATYAGREHPDRQETEKAFLDAVEDTIRRGGTAIVPSFAVGRNQELALVLANSGHDVYLDGMAKEVFKIYLNHPGFLRSKKDLERAYRNLKVVHGHHARKGALDGSVVLTSSGMLDGGPVLYYLEQLHKDPKSSVFLSGYQVEGSNGRSLLDTGHVNIKGNSMKVECEVRKFDFSAHAGHKDLVHFAKESGAKDIVLFHGDKPDEMRTDLEKFANVHTPAVGEKITFRD